MSTTAEVQKTGNVSRIINRLSQDQTQLFSTKGVERRGVGTSSTMASSTDNKKKYCKARYSYAATQADELSFKEDELIEAYEQIEDGWMKGKMLSTQETGLFPTNFVHFLTDAEVDTEVKHNNTKPPVATGSSITSAIVSSFKDKPEKQQLKGISSTVAGSTTMEEKTDEKKTDHTTSTTAAAAVTTRPLISTSKRRVPSTSSSIGGEPEHSISTGTTGIDTSKNKIQEKALVLYPYDAEQEDELQLVENTQIIVLDKHCSDDGWFFGQNHQGKRGVFPSNFVKLLPPTTEKKEPATPPTPPPSKPPKPMMPVTNEAPTPVVPTSASTPQNIASKSTTSVNVPASATSKSKISELQSRVFGNRLPPKPGDKPVRPVTTIMEHVSLPSDLNNESTSTEKDKEAVMSHPQRDRPRQANKRPPSVMHVPTATTIEPVSNGLSNHSGPTITSFPSKEPSSTIVQKPATSSKKPEVDITKDTPKTSLSYKTQTEVIITPTKKAQTPPSAAPITITPHSSIPLLHGNEDEPVTRRQYNQLVTAFNELVRTCDTMKAELTALHNSHV